jgi:hypothetical protein
MMIDGLSHRYGMLPSQVLRQADTFDLWIMDSALSFENYHHKKQQNGGIDPIPDYSIDELQAKLAKAQTIKPL